MRFRNSLKRRRLADDRESRAHFILTAGGDGTVSEETGSALKYILHDDNMRVTEIGYWGPEGWVRHAVDLSIEEAKAWSPTPESAVPTESIQETEKE